MDFWGEAMANLQVAAQNHVNFTRVRLSEIQRRRRGNTSSLGHPKIDVFIEKHHQLPKTMHN